MRALVRENALCAFLAGVGSATIAWLGLYGFAWNDYEREALPAFSALTRGHVLEFLRLVPAYGGSLVERAPFALLPGLWGGGQLAVYRMVALPCLLAGGALGVWLVAQMRAAGRPVLWRAVALGVCVANPLTIRALELGHPEELLGGVLCVAAVLLAARERPLWAGLALGLAIANKEWALLAVGPVLLALPQRRVLCLLSMSAVVGFLTVPLMLVGSGAFVAGARGVASPATVIFQPMQVFWFLGHHSANAGRLLGAVKHDFRLAPTWIGEVSHPLVIAVAAPLSWLAWRMRPSGGRSSTAGEHPGRGAVCQADALLLLALLLLLRCMLDTWDNVYYPLPFILALVVWESHALARPPILALAATVLVWFNVWLSVHVSADAQAAFFLVWTLPLSAGLALRLYAPGLAGRRLGAVGAYLQADLLWPAKSRAPAQPARATAAQEMTVSSLGSPVNTS
ncbi:MAG TPA: glycosyltransferase 87 family protein [Solirubrobacteraceae bacterium]|nr:glycosyltransferase 87 family protein [Solirubrobacteraceae bacterium]